MAEGRLETESRCQECLAIIKGEITSNNLSKRRVRTRTHGVVGGRGLVAPSYPIFKAKLMTQPLSGMTGISMLCGESPLRRSYRRTR